MPTGVDRTYVPTLDNNGFRLQIDGLDKRPIRQRIQQRREEGCCWTCTCTLVGS